jgi:hypothetical protein
MNELRETVAKALLNAKIEGAIRIDQECASSHRACAPILRINYDQMTAAIMQAIAKDAVVIERGRWERVKEEYVTAICLLYEKDRYVQNPRRYG